MDPRLDLRPLEGGRRPAVEPLQSHRRRTIVAEALHILHKYVRQPGAREEVARGRAHARQAPARRGHPELAGARGVETHLEIWRARHAAGGAPGVTAVDALRRGPRASEHPRAAHIDRALHEMEVVPFGEPPRVGRRGAAPGVVVLLARVDGAALELKRVAARVAVAQRVLGLVLRQLRAERRVDRHQRGWRLGLHQADRLYLRAAWKISASATNVSGSPSDRGAAHDHGRGLWPRPSLPWHAPRSKDPVQPRKQTAAQRLPGRIRAPASAMAQER